MELEKFFGGEDAARYAATLTNEWKNEDEEILDAESLIESMNYHDGEYPLDEEDETEYYVVDSHGALGFTGDQGKTYYWAFVPTNMPGAVAGPAEGETVAAELFCPSCGAPVDAEWCFCDKCGCKLK